MLRSNCRSVRCTRGKTTLPTVVTFFSFAIAVYSYNLTKYPLVIKMSGQKAMLINKDVIVRIFWP
jgi:hypothetical protein